MHFVRQAKLFQCDRDLDAIGCRKGVQLQHGWMRGRPSLADWMGGKVEHWSCLLYERRLDRPRRRKRWSARWIPRWAGLEGLACRVFSDRAGGTAAESPVVGIDFLDRHVSPLGWLVEHALQSFGHFLDDLGLLLRGGSFAEKVALAYTSDSRWRNRAELIVGRRDIAAFLARKWAKELDYRLIKELWAFAGYRIAVRYAYEWHDDSGNWFRSYGNENWEFDN